MYKCYKYLIKPNKQQKQIIEEQFIGTTKIHNMYVDDIINKRLIPKLGKELYDLYIKKDETLLSYNKVFLVNELFKSSDKNDYKKFRAYNRYPKSITCPVLPRQIQRVYIENEKINIPYIGKVKFVYSRQIPNEGNIKRITITKTENKKFYICILVENSNGFAKILNLDNSIGLDYSSTHFIVDSDGNKYDTPHFYRDKEKAIRKKQNELSRCVKGSNNYYKKKIELFNIHNNISNRRNDYLHKLSTNIANKYDYVFIENIDLESISKKNNLGKATYDNSYGSFVLMLEYKMKERGKVLKKIDRYYPSTKMCSSCGYINKDIKLSDRNWRCPICNSNHDRDINAATNIQKEGKRIISSGG